MGNLFSEEEKDDGYGHMATYGRYVRHMEAQRDYSSDDTRDDGYGQHEGQSYNPVSDSDDTRDGSYTQHRGQSYNRVSDSDDTRDDGYGQDAYEGCRKFMRSAAAKSAVSGPKGFGNMSRIEGAREAVIAALKEYHPGFFEAMPKRKDGLPDQRYGAINDVYAVMGQYMPVLNKDGSLHRGCRVYKIILQEAGIDYNTLTERESNDAYHYWNERDPITGMIRNPRLASALRMAHAVKHIGSLDAGHANCLLYLAGLKNEDRGRQGNKDAMSADTARIKKKRAQTQHRTGMATRANNAIARHRERQNEGQREEYEQYQRREYERQEYERRRRQEEEDEHRRCQEEYERRRRQEEEDERRRQEKEEWERYFRQMEEDERRWRQEEDERWRQEEEEYEQRYYGTVVSIKKNHANGTPFAFVHWQHGNIFLHPSDMRLGEWVDVGDEINYSIGYFNDRQKCVDVVITEYSG